MIGKLILSDGTTFEGESFGAEVSTSGEVVFNTGMVGYPETFTDPSYFGQILVLTYPLIGNYGVPEKTYFESKQIQIKGLIVQNYIDTPSHFQSLKTLSSWLKEENIPALFGIDTRSLTTKLRDHGVMLGKMQLGNKAVGQYDPNTENVLPFVSPKDVEEYGSGKKTVVLIDCGSKEYIIRSLVLRGVRVLRVPWNYNPLSKKINFDGVVISNGPGDPKQAKQTIEVIKQLMHQNVPTFGVCLGNQLLALAAGGDTYKLRFGHRGQNQPSQDLISKKAVITSQNHGFAVDPKKLSSEWTQWFINLNDGTNEGIRHRKKPFLSVQFHPEATPGPTDAGYLFDEFISMI
jgi:carbamoyl-phosphate synthase small subunit